MNSGLRVAALAAVAFLQIEAVHANDRKNEREMRIEQITSSLGFMSVYDVGDFLIDVLPGVEDGIYCREFTRMLGKASVYDRGEVVERVAHKVYVDEGCFATVSRLVSVYDVSSAIKALQSRGIFMKSIGK